MYLREIDGITYECEDTGEAVCYRRYDVKYKTQIEIYAPKQTERERTEAQNEITGLLSEIYIRSMAEGDEYGV